MLNAYFDETGDETDANSTVCGIGGVLAPATHWESLSVGWKEILDREHLCYWHMREFTLSVGIFKDWSDDEPRRRKVYGELWKLIREANPMFMGYFVPLSDYRSIFNGDHRKMLVGAYFQAYVRLIGAMFEQFVLPLGDQISRILPTFDDKRGFKGEMWAVYDTITDLNDFEGRLKKPVFEDMRKIIPLQVADIIAYECAKEYDRRLLRGRAKRWGFLQIEEMIKSKTGSESELGPEFPVHFASGSELEGMRDAITNISAYFP